LFLYNLVIGNADVSAATIGNPKSTSQLISIEESRNLFTKQQAIVKVSWLLLFWDYWFVFGPCCCFIW